MPQLIDFNGLPGLQFPEAKICAQGGQLLQFRDWFFLSSEARYEFFAPIRGGIPLCFPWFGPKQGDVQHGFARTSMWELDETRPRMTLSNDDLPDPKMWAPFSCTLEYRFGETLGISWSVENTGREAFEFEMLLHSYFAVSDVRNIEIEGLDGQIYRDQNAGNTQKTQVGTLRMSQPTTFTFDQFGGPVWIRDTTRTIELRPQKGCRSTVVWNPFAALNDVPETQWPRFVCVESGCVGAEKIVLRAGQKTEMAIEIAVS